MFGSPSGCIFEPSSRSLSLASLCSLFVHCEQVSNFQSFLLGSVSVSNDLILSEPSLLSSSLYSSSPEVCARVLAASAADIPSYLNNLKSRTPLFQFTLDSASQVHVLTGKDALKLLLSPVPSNLELVGVSGDSIHANVMGRLFVALRDPTTGCIYHVDFGVAHGLDGCPLNILSLPLLYQSGAIAHF